MSTQSTGHIRDEECGMEALKGGWQKQGGHLNAHQPYRSIREGDQRHWCQGMAFRLEW